MWPGQSVTAVVSVTSQSVAAALVDIEIYGPGGQKIYQQYADRQAFAAGQTRQYPLTWQVPAGAPAGTYTLKVGTFSVGWGILYNWNNAAARFAVTS